MRADGKDRDVGAVLPGDGVAVLSVVYVRDGTVLAAHAWPQRTALDTALGSKADSASAHRPCTILSYPHG